MATSYSNFGGTGDRLKFIVATVTGGLSVTGSPIYLLNGAVDNNFYFNGVSVAGGAVQFDLAGLPYIASGSQGVIDEVKWYQNNTVTHGTWKWQGSNDASAWTDIGSSFTLGGATPFQTQTSLSGNTTAYRYYRLLGVSGTASSSPWLQEIEFKISNLVQPAPTLLSIAPPFKRVTSPVATVASPRNSGFVA